MDAPPATQPRSRWLTEWEPENETFWANTGRRIARRNLIFSIFAEHLGFSVWTLWSVVVVALPAALFPYSVDQKFWLVALPNLIGAVMRIPYTFAVARFGGRVWTAISAGLLLIPCLLLATVVPSGWLAEQSHSPQFWTLLAGAATAGVGGGNFSSSMTNISFFYPEGKKGLPLGLNAAGGNIGGVLVQPVDLDGAVLDQGAGPVEAAGLVSAAGPVERRGRAQHPPEQGGPRAGQGLHGAPPGAPAPTPTGRPRPMPAGHSSSTALPRLSFALKIRPLQKSPKT